MDPILAFLLIFVVTFAVLCEISDFRKGEGVIHTIVQKRHERKNDPYLFNAPEFKK